MRRISEILIELLIILLSSTYNILINVDRRLKSISKVYDVDLYLADHTR